MSTMKYDNTGHEKSNIAQTLSDYRSVALENIPVKSNMFYSGLSSQTFEELDEDYRRTPSASYLLKLPTYNDINITCTLLNGDRYFIKTTNFREIPQTGNKMSNLLRRPIRALIEEAEQIQISRNSYVKDSKGSQELPLQLSYDDKLWVDKYSPKGFSQLLSPEKINREVLKAIVAWNPHVFSKQQKDKSRQNWQSVDEASINKRADSSRMDVEQETNGDDEAESLGGKDFPKPDRIADTRPATKLILLCGPPGTGKTTLAHVLARHCGYRAIEVNSSDDRSVDFLRDTLSRAMQNNTIYGDAKPPCIILDEIDGVDSRAPIDFLVSLTKVPLDSGRGGDKSRRKKGAGDSGLFPITRPIICICNDQYVASLRELRKHAHVFVMTSASENRIVQRLRALCLEENISVASSALIALCKSAKGDIRSCINTLQFACQKTRQSSPSASSSVSENRRPSDPTVRDAVLDVNYTLAEMLTTGLKDEQRDVYQLWRESLCKTDLRLSLLQRQTASKRHPHSQQLQDITDQSQTQSQTDPRSVTCTDNPIDFLMASVSDFGDHDLVLRGLFENYLRPRYPDPHLVKTQVASEWLSYADTLSQFAHSGGFQGHHMLAYVPATVGAVHWLCATESRTSVQFPFTDRDARQRRTERESVLQSLMEQRASPGGGVPSPLFRSKQTVATDVVTYLSELVSPTIRAVQLRSMSPAEAQSVHRAAEVMLKCGLSFARAPTVASPGVEEEASERWRLDPSIDELLKYPLMEVSGRRRQRPEVVQLMIAEMRKLTLEARLKSISDGQKELTIHTDAVGGRVENGVGHDINPVAQDDGPEAGMTTFPFTTTSTNNVGRGVETATSSGVSHVPNRSPVVPIPVPKALPTSAMESCVRRGGAGGLSSFLKIPSFKVSTKRRLESDSKADCVSSSAEELSKKMKIVFKFKQGNSVAVRRPVMINEFLFKGEQKL